MNVICVVTQYSGEAGLIQLHQLVRSELSLPLIVKPAGTNIDSRLFKCRGGGAHRCKGTWNAGTTPRPGKGSNLTEGKSDAS